MSPDSGVTTFLSTMELLESVEVTILVRYTEDVSILKHL